MKLQLCALWHMFFMCTHTEMVPYLVPRAEGWSQRGLSSAHPTRYWSSRFVEAGTKSHSQRGRSFRAFPISPSPWKSLHQRAQSHLWEWSECVSNIIKAYPHKEYSTRTTFSSSLEVNFIEGKMTNSLTTDCIQVQIFRPECISQRVQICALYMC